ncbi:serine/threonine-protein kinase [Streptomyces wuyuanensis]|uniref:Serine/threonine protein kinase n=1 Tax=Streptomyces wuyuanensis TaxID=1196353 RepID=A0A1H0AU71_9ACTN|nr:serine/threonine-protein kinase [Streptomyces wuyuanensis]SDN36885.1 Serine/threonine protein kinase [Streptomyces wuyuanensis]
MLSPLTHDDPELLARYRLQARLGSGGMGTVYLARTPGGRTVALKTMHQAIAADPAARTRFRLETDAARIIGSQHGAAVVDADPLAETPWLATEYVLGPPLDDAVELCGPLPESGVRALGAALAGALGQLHSSDVVHRDLKPSNVMITAYGPKIIDFGIARADGDERLTRVGVAAGTPAFMSPEQATGQDHTPAGDVFALAGVLVYAASGHGPFGTGQAADLLYRVRYAEPDLTGVPAALVPVLSRCLAKQSGERPTTAQLVGELHDGRGDFADHLPDTVLMEIARRATEVWQYTPYRLPAPTGAPLPRTVPDSGSRSRTSRRRLLGLSGASALAVACAGAGAWAWLRDPDAGTTGGAGGRGATPPPVTGPTVEGQAWLKNVIPAKADTAALLAPLPVGEVAVLATGEGLLGLAALNGERRWLVRDVRESRHVHTDGKQIHVLLREEPHRSRAVLHTVDPRDGRLSPPVVFKPLVRRVALLRVGGGTAYVAAEEPGGFLWHLRALDARTGQEKWSTPLRAADVGGPDDLVVTALAVGRLILHRPASGGSGHEVSALDVRNGRQLWRTTLPGEKHGIPSLAPNSLVTDDRHVYVGGQRLQALRLTDGKAAWTFGAGRPAGAYGTPALRDGIVHAAERDKGVVAVAAADGRLRWEAETGGRPDLTVPVVVNDRFVYVMTGGSVYSVGRESKRQEWVFRRRSRTMSLHERVPRLVLTDGTDVAAVNLAFDYG